MKDQEIFPDSRRNTGNRNTGDRNTGDRNTGHRNTGYRNTGDHNTGYHNTGNRNTGYDNTGNRNTGYDNTGDHNTGDYNTGDHNTGDGNCGDRFSGHFNLNPVKLRMFDAPIECDESEVNMTLVNDLAYALSMDDDFDIERFLSLPNATESKIKELHKKHIKARKDAAKRNL